LNERSVLFQENSETIRTNIHVRADFGPATPVGKIIITYLKAKKAKNGSNI
jgi:hypothetical protein